MRTTVAALLLTLSTPSLVAGQEISGAVTFGFGAHEIDFLGQNLTTASVDGRVEMAFQNGIQLGVSMGYLNLGLGNVPVDLSGDFLGFELGYRFANGAMIGAYAEDLTLRVDTLPIDLSLRSVGVSGGYTLHGVELGAFAGETTTSPDIGLLGVGIDNVGVSATYAASPSTDLAAAVVRATIDTAGPDLDIDLVGFAGTHDLNDQVSLFGGFSRTSIDLLNLNVTTVGVGMGYDVSAFTGMATSLSLEVARTQLSQGGGSGNLDTVRLGLTFPLGGKGSEAPLNSVADSIFNPRRGALNAALTGAF